MDSLSYRNIANELLQEMKATLCVKLNLTKEQWKELSKALAWELRNHLVALTISDNKVETVYEEIKTNTYLLNDVSKILLLNIINNGEQIRDLKDDLEQKFQFFVHQLQLSRNLPDTINSVLDARDQRKLKSRVHELCNAMLERRENNSRDDDKIITLAIEVCKKTDEYTPEYDYAIYCQTLIEDKIEKLNLILPQMALSGRKNLLDVIHYTIKYIRQRDTIDALENLVHRAYSDGIIWEEDSVEFINNIELEWKKHVQTRPYPTIENYDKSEFVIEGTELEKYIGKELLVKIPQGITRIAENAFRSQEKIICVEIGADVKRIGDEAFAHCSKLESIVFRGNRLENIGRASFIYCENLKNIDLAKQNNLKFIGDKAFYKCNAISTVTIPEKVERIGSQAFSNIKKLYFYSNRMALFMTWGAFVESKALSLNIGTNHWGAPDYPAFFKATSFGSYELSNTKDIELLAHIKQIKVDPRNEFYSSRGNCLIGYGAVRLGCRYSQIPTDSSVTSIGIDAFTNSKIKEIIVPENIIELEISCFRNSELQSITLSSTLKKIGDYAFKNCVNLHKIIFAGTRKQWQEIKKGIEWNNNIATESVQCIDGTSALTDS